MSIEAMKDALITLVFARGSIEDWGGYASEYFQNKHDLKGDIIKVDKAITSLRQAIEQAEKQVAFKIYKPTPPRLAIPSVNDAKLPWVYDQDPSSGNVASMWVTPVKATPQPQREWVGLTHQEVAELLERGDVAESNEKVGWYVLPYSFAQAIEAKLKEKNT